MNNYLIIININLHDLYIDSENVSAQWARALRACIEPFVLKGRGRERERELQALYSTTVSLAIQSHALVRFSIAFF